MSITSQQNGSVFEPNTIEAMAAAFEETCKALQLSQSASVVKEVIAKHIIELAQSGELNPKNLHFETLKALNPAPAR